MNALTSTVSRFLVPLAVVVAVAGCHRSEPPNAESPVAATSPVEVEAQVEVEALDRDRARHVLNRFAFGPRPGDVEGLVEEGMDGWLERQLNAPADGADLPSLRDAYPYAYMAALELKHPNAPREDQEMLEGMAPGPNGPIQRRDILHQLQAELLSRQVLSEHQLREVMVDFWFNHFNVDAQKRQVHYVAGDFLRNVIRRHALGRFEDMLIAVATHPAMMLYLDNSQSSVLRPGPDGERGGINENFARELLELHTVGVDGGYTQADVEEVARVLSGWGVADLGFAYRQAEHDLGAKEVMGHEFPAGGGMDEGLSLLRWLAHHPSTVRFLATKLATRFVTDTPSEEFVERIATVFRESDGDISTVMRAIAADPDFWAEANRNSKVKTPIEWLNSALRGIGAVPAEVDVFRAAQRLRQPLLAMPIPTGYPERAEEWANGAQLGMRWQIASQLSNGRLPGVRYTPGAYPANANDADSLVRALNQDLLGGASDTTVDALNRQLGRIRDPERRRIQGLILALSSPEFQRQ